MTDPEEHLSPEEQLDAIIAEATSRALDRSKRFSTIRKFTSLGGVAAALIALILVFTDMKDASRFFGLLTGVLVIATGVCNIIVSRAENLIHQVIFFGRNVIRADYLICFLGAALIFFYIFLF